MNDHMNAAGSFRRRSALTGVLVLFATMGPAAFAAEAEAPPSPQPQAATALRVAVHAHTSISTGTQAPEQAAASFKQAGIEAIIFTDSLKRRWEFGIRPLQALVKYAVEQPSVLRYGAANYLKRVQALNGPGSPLAIAGIEAAPFYYWARSPFDRRGGQIRNWQQHLLVFGSNDAKRLAALPIEKFSAYDGDQGALPYQTFIDAVVDTGALVFWAHPMTGHLGHHGRVEDFTEPYPHLLKTTSGYHGFALTYLGYLSLVDAGGIWDQLLAEYTRGARARPVWIIGELDWRGTERPCDAVLTRVLAQDRTESGILDAIRNAGKPCGRNYARYTDQGWNGFRYSRVRRRSV